MKVALLFLTIVGLSLALPSPRKAFHEHLDDLMELAFQEMGDEFVHLMEHYQEFEEFNIAVNYLATNDFKELVYEMEAIPEFKAFVEFLENDNIDIGFMIDRFNEMLEEIVEDTPKRTRHEISGNDFASFFADCLALLPLDKLGALYEQKREEFEDFRVALDNLQSEELENIRTALMDNELFQAELKTLSDNHINVEAMFYAWENLMKGQ